MKEADKVMRKMEKQRNGFVAALETAGTDHAEIARIGRELAVAESALAEAEEQWLELASELEDR